MEMSEDDLELSRPLMMEGIEVREEDPLPPSGYRAIVAAAFTMNYSIGVGIFGLPYAFSRGGLILGLVLMIWSLFMAVLTSQWLIEVCSRAFAWKRAEEITPPSSHDLDIQASGDYVDYRVEADFVIPMDDKIEVGGLCKIFLGYPGKLLYEFMLFASMYGALWSYAAVFSSSLSSIIPIPFLTWHTNCSADPTFACQISYWIFLGIYAVIVIPLSMQDLAGQVIVQVALTITRIFGIALVVITSLAAMFYELPYGQTGGSIPYFSPIKWFDMSGFGLVMTSATFAMMVQHGVPMLIQPIRTKNRKTLAFVSVGGVTAAGLMYILVGALASVYLGLDTKQLISLNWQQYTGSFSTHPVGRPIWATIISYCVVLFPVPTVISTYALSGATLGNGIFYGLPNSWNRNGSFFLLKILCRLLAVGPPLILAAITDQLALIIEITGLAAFFIVYIIPGALQIVSRIRLYRRWGDSSTPYSWPLLGNPLFCILAISFGIFAFVFSLVQLVLEFV